MTVVELNETGDLERMLAKFTVSDMPVGYSLVPSPVPSFQRCMFKGGDFVASIVHIKLMYSIV